MITRIHIFICIYIYIHIFKRRARIAVWLLAAMRTVKHGTTGLLHGLLRLWPFVTNPLYSPPFLSVEVFAMVVHNEL